MRRLAFVLIASVAAACSSPPPDLYTLAAQPGPVVHGTARSVELRRFGLAAYLDRPEIVRSSAAYRLQVTTTERWGEPLGKMLGRVFAEDLVERMPDTAVFNETGAVSTQPDKVVAVDVQRFDADASGEVVLLAQVAVRPADDTRPAEARTLRIAARPGGKSVADQVAAMSRALAQLADTVAGILARP